MADKSPVSLTPRTIALPNRGPGRIAFLDLGHRERPVDAIFFHANGFNALPRMRLRV